MAYKQVRLPAELVNSADKQAEFNYRSSPKQIELWAQLGREVEARMTPVDLAAFNLGEIEVSISRKKSPRIELSDVVANLELSRQNGTLQNQALQGNIWFEESPDHPGFLIRTNGKKRELGIFENGKFRLANKKSNETPIKKSKRS